MVLFILVTGCSDIQESLSDEGQLPAPSSLSHDVFGRDSRGYGTRGRGSGRQSFLIWFFLTQVDPFWRGACSMLSSGRFLVKHYLPTNYAYGE